MAIILETVDLDIRPAKQSLNKLANDFDNVGRKSGDNFEKGFTKGISDLPAKTKAMAGQMKASFMGAFAGFGAANLMANAISGITGVISGAVDGFKALDTAVRNVGTLGVKNTNAVSQAMNQLSKTSVDSAQALTSGLYDAISAGTVKVKDGLVDIAGAQAFVATASRAAVVGLSDTGSVINGLTSVMNAYKAEAIDAEKYGDIFFATQNTGKTTIAELNGALASVIPTAAGMKIPFEQVAAAIATMTKSGVKTVVATTQLRAAMVELQKPAPLLAKAMKAAGVSLESIQAEGLQASLAKLGEEFQRSGKSATQMFGSVEAAGAVMLLSGENAKMAAEDLKSIEAGQGGVAKAYEDAAKSIDNRKTILGNRIQAVFNDIFIAVEPVLTFILENIDTLILVVASLATAILVVLMPAIWAFVASIWASVAAFVAANLATGGLILAIGLLVAGIILLIQNWDVVYAWMAKIARAAWDWIVGAFNAVIDVVKDVIGFWMKWLNIFGLLYQGFKFLYGYIRPLIDEYFPALGKAIDSVVGWFTALWKSIVGAAEGVLKFLGLMGDDTEATKENSKAKNENTKAKKENAKATDELSEAEMRAKGIFEDTAASIAAKKQEIEDYKNALKLAEKGTEEYTEIQKKLNELLGIKTETAAKKTIESLDNLKKKYINLSNELDKLKLFEKIYAMAEAERVEKIRLDELAKSLAAVSKLRRESAISTDEGINSTPRLTKATDEYTESLKGKNKELERTIDFTKKLQEEEEKLADSQETSSEKMLEILTEGGMTIEQMAKDISGVLGDSFAAVLTGQEGFMKKFLVGMVDMVQQAVNIIGAWILANQVKNWTGILPAGGELVALGQWIGTMALINGVLIAAKSGIGAEEGVIGIDKSYNKKAGRSDSIALMVAPNESILNASATNRERAILEHINKGGSSYDYFMKHYGQTDKKDGTTLRTPNDRMMLKELRTIKRAVIHTAQTNELMSRDKLQTVVNLNNETWRY